MVHIKKKKKILKNTTLASKWRAEGWDSEGMLEDDAGEPASLG